MAVAVFGLPAKVRPGNRGKDGMTEGRYRLIGSTASPYAIKLRALMRYRRIPFDWVIMTKALRAATAHLRPMLIPVLQYPDGTLSRRNHRAGLRSGSAASGPLGHSRRQGRRLRLRPAGRPRRRMGGETAVPVPLVGSGGPGLCLALGRRGMVDVGSRDRQRAGNRGFPQAPDFAHGHSRRHRRKQAAAGRKLPEDPGWRSSRMSA